MAEVACHLDDTNNNRTELQEKSAKVILKRFRKALEIAKIKNPETEGPGLFAAKLFEEMNGQRSDFVHSYPITNKSNEQIPHRRHDGKGKHFEITNDFLDDFISRLAMVSDKLYEIRGSVYSEK